MSFEIVAAPHKTIPVISDLREKLVCHPVYQSVNTRARLAVFMQHHVFAVWDFMSLLKRLESDLTRQTIPWTPGPNSWLTREIYEIVQGEECDQLPDGRIMSHFEAYLEAMRMLEVDTSAIDTFLELLTQGVPPLQALEHPAIPPAAAIFTAESLNIATQGSTAEVAAAFFFGREDIIPDMFIPLLKTVEDVLNQHSCAGIFNAMWSSTVAPRGNRPENTRGPYPRKRRRPSTCGSGQGARTHRPLPALGRCIGLFRSIRFQASLAFSDSAKVLKVQVLGGSLTDAYSSF